MRYTLVGSIRSPFVRACRMLMHQNGIDFDFRVLNFVDDPKDAEALARETPVNRVPILLDGAQKIFDSRVIVSHLTRTHGLRALSLDEENYVTAIYGGMDAAVALYLLKRDGIDVSGPGFYFARQRARIPASLAFVTPWARRLDASRADDWNYASMSLFSFLYWGEARGSLTVTDYPELAAFAERFADAPGVRQTTFPR